MIDIKKFWQNLLSLDSNKITGNNFNHNTYYLQII